MQKLILTGDSCILKVRQSSLFWNSKQTRITFCWRLKRIITTRHACPSCAQQKACKSSIKTYKLGLREKTKDITNRERNTYLFDCSYRRFNHFWILDPYVYRRPGQPGNRGYHHLHRLPHCSRRHGIHDMGHHQTSPRIKESLRPLGQPTCRPTDEIECP